MCLRGRASGAGTGVPGRGRPGAGAHGIVPRMDGGVRLAFRDVAKRYDARVVFRSLSGEAGPGEVLLVTGPNGSGKSTLLGILCGLVRPTRGEVRWTSGAGDACLGRSDWRRHVGVVAPWTAVYEELTAMENLRFFATLRAVAEAPSRCRECIEAVGLEPQRATPAGGFSTGMLQRLKIAQAMLHSPPVLLLDEPGSNLDPVGQDWLAGWVAERVAAGTTVVLATNDRGEMTWGTRRVALPG